MTSDIKPHRFTSAPRQLPPLAYTFLFGSLAGYLCLGILHLWDVEFLTATHTPQAGPPPYPPLVISAVPGMLSLTPESRVYLQAAIVLALFALYAVALVRWDSLALTPIRMAKIGATIGLAAWLVPLLNSADVFTYIGYGRLVTAHGLSPYVVEYGEIQDIYSPYAWNRPTMPYGPVALPPMLIAALLSDVSILVAVYGWKFMVMTGHAATAYLAFRCSPTLVPWSPIKSAFVLFFNPLVLFELGINGHNDGFLGLFALLAIRLLQVGRPGAALLSACLGALVKPPAVFLAMAVAVYLVRQRAWRALVCAGVTSGAVVGVTLALLVPPRSAAMLVVQSPHDSVGRWFRAGEMDAVISLILALLVGLAGYALWRLLTVRRITDIVSETTFAMLGLLMVLQHLVHPWYVTWLVPYAALLDHDRVRRVILIYTCTVFTLYSTTPMIVPFAGLQGVWGGAVARLIAHGILLTAIAPLLKPKRRTQPAEVVG